MKAEDIRKQFTKESGIEWKNSQNEPDIDYVIWLENKLNSQPDSKEKFKCSTDKKKCIHYFKSDCMYNGQCDDKIRISR